MQQTAHEKDKNGEIQENMTAIPLNELVGITRNTIAFTLVYGFVIIGFSLYQLWLNYKQSKVQDTAQQQLKVLEEILNEIKKR